MVQMTDLKKPKDSKELKNVEGRAGNPYNSESERKVYRSTEKDSMRKKDGQKKEPVEKLIHR